MSATPETNFPSSATRRKGCASEFAYPTVEAALRTADAILGNRAKSVWIVDPQGNLILPADHVRLRASASRSAR